MTQKRHAVIWDVPARGSLKKIHDHIRRDSPHAAKKVKKAISDRPQGLSVFQERHPKQAHLEGERGNNRSVPIWS